jgi:ketosteroid isomerase-like protein
MAGMADTFAKALQRTEETRDPDPLVQLFAQDAELSNYTHRESGLEGARRFWFTYLEQFDGIRSRFRRLIEADGQAALVWTSEGTLKGGQPIAYSGVSVIGFDGDKVRRFETYYDSAAFLRPGPKG